MRFVRVSAIFLSILALCSFAAAKQNKMGIHEISNVSFSSQVRAGSVVMPAGDYQVRHTMEGEDHIMVFQRQHEKAEFRVKCTLVPLAGKAARTEASFQTNAGGERVLEELIFEGDTAKHVF
jgi:hypothetical protein